MEVPPVVTTSEDEHLIRQIREGNAIFSTNLSQIPKREAKPGETSIIIRSDPLEDVEAMAATLQERYPQACRNITAPIRNIYEYFDHYDVQLHGSGIIHLVLNKIAEFNASKEKRILSFTEYWKHQNSENFLSLDQDTTKVLFTDEEHEYYGDDFLQEALEKLKVLRSTMVPLVPEVLSASPYPSPAVLLATSARESNPIPFALPPSSRSTTVSSQRDTSQPSFASQSKPTSPLLHPPQNHALAKKESSKTKTPSLPITGYRWSTDSELQDSTQGTHDNLEQDPIQRHSSFPIMPSRQEYLFSGGGLERRSRSDNGPGRTNTSRMVPMNVAPHFQKANYARPRGLSSAYRRDRKSPIIRPMQGPGQALHMPPSRFVNFNSQFPNMVPGFTGVFPYPLMQPIPHGHPAVMVNLPRQERGGQVTGHPIFTGGALPLAQQYHNPLYGKTLPHNSGAITINDLSLQGRQQETNHLHNPKIRARPSQGPAATPTESGGYPISNVKPQWIFDNANIRQGNPSQRISNDARILEYQDTQSQYKSHNGNRKFSVNRGSFRFDPHNTYPTYENRQKAFRESDSRHSSCVQQYSNRASHDNRNWDQSVHPDFMNSSRDVNDYPQHAAQEIRQNYAQSRSVEQQIMLPDSEDLLARQQAESEDHFKEQQRGSTHTENPTTNSGTGALSSKGGHAMHNPQVPLHFYQGESPTNLQSQPQQDETNDTIYVGGNGITSENLRQLFESIGRIIEIIGPLLSNKLKRPDVPYYYGFVKYAYPKDASRAVEQLNGTRTADGAHLTVNFRSPSIKDANLHRQTDGTSVCRDSSIAFENAGQPNGRTQQNVGKRDRTNFVEHTSNSDTLPTPDATEKSFTTVYSQYNSRHTSPKNNKRGKNKKKGSHSTTQTTPSRKGSLTALAVSLSQHGTDHPFELLPGSDYSRLGQARKDHLDRTDFRKSKHQGSDENNLVVRNYRSHLASDGSPKKKIRKPGSKAAHGRDQASIASAMKDYSNELRQIASAERSTSKEINPLSHEEWPSFAEFSTRVTSQERYSPPPGQRQGTTPKRSAVNRNTVMRSSTPKTPKTPSHEIPVEAISQTQGTDDRIRQSPCSAACNEKVLETTPIKGKAVQDEEKFDDDKITLEAAHSSSGDPVSLLKGPVLGLAPPSNTSKVEAFDELAQETGEYSTHTNLGPKIIQKPGDAPAELSKIDIVQVTEGQSVEGLERTETIIDSLIEGPKLGEKDQEQERAKIEQASLSLDLVEPSIAEYGTSVLTSESTMIPEVESVDAKEIDNRTVNSSMGSNLAQDPRTSHRGEKSIVAHAPPFASTLLLDNPDMEKEIEGDVSSQPPEISRGASTTPVPYAISTHKKRKNKRIHIGESFPKKVRAFTNQRSDKRKASNLEREEVSGTGSDTTKEEAVSEDSSSLLVAKMGGSLELSSEYRNYPQVNEAHAVEDLYVSAKKPRFLGSWQLAPIQTHPKAARPHPLLLYSTDSENKVEEVDPSKKIALAILDCVRTEDGLTSTSLQPSSHIESKIEGAPQSVLDVGVGQSSEVKEDEAPTSPQPVTEEKPPDLKKKKVKGKKKKKSRDTSTAESSATSASGKKTNIMNSPISLSTVGREEMFPPLGSSKVKHNQAVLDEARDDVAETNTVTKDLNASPKGKARAVLETPQVILLNANTISSNQQPKDGKIGDVAASIAKYYQKKPIYTAKIVHELENRLADGHSEASIVTSGSVFMPADQSADASVSPNSDPRTQLSEASMKQHQESLTVDADVMQPRQHRRTSSVAMSELSTASSRQRKLFSEVASSADRTISPAAKASNSNSGKGYVKENEKENAAAGAIDIIIESEGGPSMGKRKASLSFSKNADDPWGLPAGERMWGSEGVRHFDERFEELRATSIKKPLGR